MRAYLHILKMEFLTHLEYRVNLMVGPIAIFSSLFINGLLWWLILQTSGQETIHGMTFKSLNLYFVVAFVVHQLRANWEVNFNIIEEIREGKITRFLTRPISFFWNWFVIWLGRNSAFAILYGAMLVVLHFIYPDEIFPKIWQGPAFLLTMFLSMLLSHCIYMCLIATNFWFHDVTGLIVGYNLFSMILFGTIVPYTFYPAWALKILNLSPFPWLVSFPISIATGKLAAADFFPGLLATLAWITGIGLFFRWEFRKAIKAYGGYGG